VALVVTGSVFAFARPGYHPHVVQLKDEPLPYKHVSYDTRAVRKAFKSAGFTLTFKSRSRLGTIYGDPRDILEVDVFGDPTKVEQAGFHDLTSDSVVKVGPDCTSGTRDALIWHSNARAVVDCSRTTRARWWLALVHRAFAHL
jgi:hypothetical protein